MAQKTTTELKVFLEGTLAQYNALTDKTGTVFFDRNRRAVYAEGVLITSDVIDVKVENGILKAKYVGQTSYTDLANLAIPDEFVRFNEAQNLSDPQKAQARTNIGAASTDTLATELAKKVDAVAGKQLSTEDFTTALKTKLEGLFNYDDTTITAAVESLQDQIDTLVGSEDASTAIDTFNEIIAFLDGIEDETLEGIIAGIENQIGELRTKLITAEGNISTNTNNISALTGRLNDFGTNLNTLSGNLSTLQGTVSFQGNQINGLATDVDALKIKDYAPKVWEF